MSMKPTKVSGCNEDGNIYDNKGDDSDEGC